MNRPYRPVVHGSFAFDFRPEITLYRSSGSWNLECAKIYDRLLRERIASAPEKRRCVIQDDRRWTYDTPEAGDVINGTIKFLSEYYEELYIAYLFRRDQKHLYKLIIDSHAAGSRGRIRRKFFTDLEAAVEWLRSEDFEFPDITEDDFPEPIGAEHYLKDLNDGKE